MREGIHKRDLSVFTKKIEQGDGLMVLTFSRMKDFVKINRLIESHGLTVTILVEKNSHGLGDNKPAGMDHDTVFPNFFKKL
jgi:hypothetical protein